MSALVRRLTLKLGACGGEYSRMKFSVPFLSLAAAVTMAACGSSGGSPLTPKLSNLLPIGGVGASPAAGPGAGTPGPPPTPTPVPMPSPQGPTPTATATL